MRCEHRGRRRRGGGHHLHRVLERRGVLRSVRVEHEVAARWARRRSGSRRARRWRRRWRPRSTLRRHTLVPATAASVHGIAPAVAVEHRQRPQVDRVVAHVPADDVGQRVQVGAAVVVDHALGVAGGAGGVVERDGVPLVVGQRPVEVRVAAGEERPRTRSRRGARRRFGQRVVDVDDQDLARAVATAPRGPPARTRVSVISTLASP